MENHSPRDSVSRLGRWFHANIDFSMKYFADRMARVAGDR
ncbi:hypothetical protein CAter282_1670 [Collimonas arenae]|uniref:Uncharacterized protein n=1 Tax=Collimonas arenae TaxID=279058 RepID=A0A127QIM2_9BURK|nr:hypothetical protein CAter10_1801 [Collimonas arenae]AMP09452.1 hypothetical protein CAter282_1670 [Collimonas arenae]